MPAAWLRKVEKGSFCASAAHSYLPCFFVHHALRDSTASVDELRFKALRAVLSPTSYESGKAERKALRAFKKGSV